MLFFFLVLDFSALKCERIVLPVYAVYTGSIELEENGSPNFACERFL